MSTSGPTQQESIARERLPPAIGVDTDGLVHRADAQFGDRVIITDGHGGVVTSHDLHGRGRQDWVAFVRQRRGWADEWLGERLSRSEIDNRIAEAQR